MARDSVAITQLALSSGVAEPAGTTIAPSNGATIPAGGDTRKLIIRITNTYGSERTVTVRAGSAPPAFRQGLGDATITVPATSGVRYVTVESARFVQADGSIHLDFETGMTGKVMAFRLPDEL
ncbi:MAG: hypothetical protein GX446_03310 [Chthonomonadales bacterium]|nr:hypothetical protein [Chthonomonadales bacterium]